MKHIFDRKISDRTLKGYDALSEIKGWLNNAKEIDNLKFYYYPPSSKFPAESQSLKNQPTKEVLSFLSNHFPESSNFFVEIQQKIYRSGKCEIILREINLNGEITKIAVLNIKNVK